MGHSEYSCLRTVCVCESLSHVLLFVTPWAVARQAPLSMEFSRQEYWSGLPFPSQGIFLTQGLNSGLPYCSQILYHMSHRGSPFQNRTQSVAEESQTNVLNLKNVASEAGSFSGRF